MLRNSFCLAVLVLLAVAPTRSQEGFSLFTTDFPPEEFAARRAAIYKAIGPERIGVGAGRAGARRATRGSVSRTSSIT